MTEEGTSKEEEKDVFTSDDIIADLLNEVKSSEQPFSVDKLAGYASPDVDIKSKKSHKSHKHKSKKKKESRRSRSRSSSSRNRKRSRSPSKKHKKKKSKRERSRSRSRSRSKRRRRSSRESTSEKIENNKKEEKENSDNTPTISNKEEEKPNVPKEQDPNYDSEKSFRPLVSYDYDDDLALGKDNSIVVKKSEQKLSINITTVIPTVEEEKPVKEDGEIVDDDDNDKKEKKNFETEFWNDLLRVNELSTDEIKKASDIIDKSNTKKRRRRSRSASSSSTGEIMRKRVEEKSKKSSRKRSRSKERRNSQERRKKSPVKIRGRGDDHYNSRRRSYSKERKRGRSRSDSRNRDRDRDRDRIYERGRDKRRRNDDYDNYRRRSPSREYIDKQKLLEIAKKKRATMCANGEQKDNATIEDFVTYCKRLQKRQEREKRRNRGEAVSEEEDSDDGNVQYKHPYALPANPIRINIVTAATNSLAQKALPSTEEKEINPAQLRLVFPVSSGAVHKENTEMIPIPKNENVPKSCTNEQKKLVALTSVEIERCRQQGIPVAPNNVPTFLASILPPPPPPPKFLPEPTFRADSPPPLPAVLYVPPKEKMIIKEPDGNMPAISDISETLKQRAVSQKRLYTNPNDFEAHRALREANEKIELWAALKSLPGKYTGTTGLKLLSAEELQPSNPRYHAWVKRDQFRNAQPAIGGVGLRLMEKMGWKQGEGLGRDATGNVEPLVLDVKSDRRGLIAEQEMSIKQRNKLNASNNVPVDLSTKNPISLLMELCAKRRWQNPQFSCEEAGSDHNKLFTWTVVVNNVQYKPLAGSRQKKEGKTIACQVALQSMGVLPRDPSLPVFI